MKKSKNTITMCTNIDCTCHNGGPCKSAKFVENFFNQTTEDFVAEVIRTGKERGFEAETILDSITTGLEIRKSLLKFKKHK